MKKQMNIKVFETLKYNFTVLGMNAEQSIKLYPFNRRIVLGVIAICLNVILHSLFLLYVADGFTEYTKSIYMFSVTLLSALNFVNTILNLTNFFKYFESVEENVNESEQYKQVLSCEKPFLMCINLI